MPTCEQLLRNETESGAQLGGGWVNKAGFLLSWSVLGSDRDKDHSPRVRSAREEEHCVWNGSLEWWSKFLVDSVSEGWLGASSAEGSGVCSSSRPMPVQGKKCHFGDF